MIYHPQYKTNHSTPCKYFTNGFIDFFKLHSFYLFRLLNACNRFLCVLFFNFNLSVLLPRRFFFLFSFRSFVASFSRLFNRLLTKVQMGYRIQAKKSPNRPFLITSLPTFFFLLRRHFGHKPPCWSLTTLSASLFFMSFLQWVTNFLYPLLIKRITIRNFKGSMSVHSNKFLSVLRLFRLIPFNWEQNPFNRLRSLMCRNLYPLHNKTKYSQQLWLNASYYEYFMLKRFKRAFNLNIIVLYMLK